MNRVILYCNVILSYQYYICCKFHSFTFLRFYIGVIAVGLIHFVYNRAAFQISAPGGTFARYATETSSTKNSTEGLFLSSTMTESPF